MICAFSCLGGLPKKTFFLGYLSQICLPTHPPQGFCEIWENERWNSGRKGQFSRWFGGVLRGLGLVWESATLPTHIWERSPKKNGLFWTPPLMLIIHSIIAFISGAGCPGSGSAGVFMFWKFPEFVKCARRSRAHLTDSGNFQNKNTPVQWQERHVAFVPWSKGFRCGENVEGVCSDLHCIG